MRSIHRSFSKYYENTELDQEIIQMRGDAERCDGYVLGHI